MTKWPIKDDPHGTNEVRNKETNGQKHGRYTTPGWDSNQGLPDEKPIP